MKRILSISIVALSAAASWGAPWPSLNADSCTVVAVGYDDQGVWRSIPMSVEYAFTGIRYSATVLTAWNPWTDKWDKDLNIPAVNTSCNLKGYTYRFYANLPTGTYYFNLSQ